MTGHRRTNDRAPSGSGRRVAVLGAAVACLSGLAGGYLAAPAFAQSEAATIAHQQALVPGTACTVAAKACVDLESQKAWLFKDGKVMRGPVRISSGGPGEETPTGHSLRVYRKEAMHLSQESRMPDGQPSKMPWSVFFEDGGIAFHGGDPARDSAGCIHLAEPDAKAWFDYLQVGDQVQVVKGSEELAARNGAGHDAEYDAHDSEDEDSR